MEQIDWAAQKERWLVSIRKRGYDWAFTLSLFFDACAELQGLQVGNLSTADMWVYVMDMRRVWNEIFAIVQDKGE